jgi:hypothetical protein
MVTLTLLKDHYRVEPGRDVAVSLSVANRGTTPDRFEVEVQGLDRDWVALPFPTFTLAPGEERTQKVLIKPPRSAESKAGTYPFVIKARSLETGQGSEVQAVLEVEPFRMISAEIEPRRASAGFFRKEANFTVRLFNLGNTDENVQLFASDPDDDCAYTFDTDRIHLAPGQQAEVKLTAQPSRIPWVGSTQLFGFTVSARSLDDPRTVCSAQGQLERYALLSPPNLLIGIVLVILGMVWYLMRPQLPTVNYLEANPTTVRDGGSVEIRWSFNHVESVTLYQEGELVASDLPPEGSRSFTLNYPSSGEGEAKEQTVTFLIEAKGRWVNKTLQRELKVTVTPPLPLPEILEFSVTPKSVGVGQPVTIIYRVRNAAEVLLEPLQLTLDPSAERYLLPEGYRPEVPGTLTFRLIARNADKKEVRSRPVTISVVEQSQARIIVFRALYQGKELGENDAVPPDSRITLEWDLRNAERAEIEPGIGAVDPSKGMWDVFPRETTKFTLRVYDSRGVPTQKTITIKVEAPPSEVPPPP